MRPMSSTTPSVPSITTSSPSRTGCVNAISRPATKFPSVRWEAKPTMIAITADEASSPPATARIWGTTSSAESSPMKMTPS